MFRPLVLVLAVSFLFSLISVSEAQVPNGVTDRVATQVLFPYDQDTTSTGGDGQTNDRNTWVQVTNTSTTEQVWIHVQILRSSSPTNLCEESDFVDLLTPRDTHVYNMQTIRRNQAGAAILGANPGVDAAVADTKGFVFITPIIGQNDRRAISFQNLIGSVVIFDNERDFGYRVNALGRDAINLASGAILPDGQVLDGAATGLRTIIPSQFSFEIAADDDFDLVSADVVIISFDDSFNPGPLTGYEPVPGTSAIDPFIVGLDEDFISCNDFALGCYADLGINNNGLPFANGLINDNGATPPINLCGGEDPFGSIAPWAQVGWAFTPVISASQNVISFFGFESDNDNVGGAVWTRAE